MPKPIRLKVTVTCVVEYDANPAHYPDGATPEDMLAIDMNNADEDAFQFMDSDKAVWSVSGEVL